MSLIQKRLISTVVFKGNTYNSSKSAVVKAYVDHRVKEHCKDTGLDDQGAETAEIPGPAHSGGWFKTEPFHLTMEVKKKDGTPIKTLNPNAGNKETVKHHFYIASSPEDLNAKATTWWAGQNSSTK